MNNKHTYFITAYIPSDENRVVTSIYLLMKLGYITTKYLWIDIENTGGIGTGIDFDSWSNKEAEAYKRLIKVHNWDELSELIDGDIEDAMEVRNKFKEKLNKLKSE